MCGVKQCGPKFVIYEPIRVQSTKIVRRRLRFSSKLWVVLLYLGKDEGGSTMLCGIIINLVLGLTKCAPLPTLEHSKQLVTRECTKSPTNNEI